MAGGDHHPHRGPRPDPGPSGGARSLCRQLATILPTCQDKLDQLLDDLRSGLASLGVGRDQIRAVLDQIFFGSIASVVGGILAGVASTFSNLLFLLFVVAFMAVDAVDAVGFSVINFIIQSIIQPKFVSDAVNLSLTLTFLSLVFWTFVIGPLGAVLAIPLTLLAEALLLDVDPSTRWISSLLVGGPVPPEEADTAKMPESEPDASTDSAAVR